MRKKGLQPEDMTEKELADIGRDMLSGNGESIAGLEIVGEQMENSGRRTLIIKADKAYNAYRDMLHYYAVRNLVEYSVSGTENSVSSMIDTLSAKRETHG
jgi:hypothetical protein